MQRSRANGFTLIELIIVVAIIAILAALAYFNYAKYSMRARRADGKNVITAIAAAEERYYTVYNQYTTTISNLGLSATSEKGYYVVTIANGGDPATYTLTATPQAPQDKDTGCMNLSMTNAGVKTYTGDGKNGSCW